MIEFIEENLQEAQKGLTQLIANKEVLAKIAKAGQAMGDCLKDGGHIYSCGNGGSMCDAMHFAEELSGRFRGDRKALGAIAIADGAYLSCVSNDFGYEHVFSRFLEAQGRKGDILLAISTSGKSENVLRAVNYARDAGIISVAMTGRPDSPVGSAADIDICTPVGKFADRVQELHIKVIHILIELVERQLFPENYGAPK